jgi:hypothetical protein
MKLTVVCNVQIEQNMQRWERNTFMLTTKYEEKLTWFILENHSSIMKRIHSGNICYMHFPHAFFAIVHATLALILIYCIYKSIVAKLSTAKIVLSLLHRFRDYLSCISSNFCSCEYVTN